MNRILIIFTLLTFLNVVISTIKSILTIKGGKFLAALGNAISYGVYTYVIVYTTMDGIETWQKALISIACNLIGVYLVKFIEEKLRKDRLWVFNATVKTKRSDIEFIYNRLKEKGIESVYEEIAPDKLYSFRVFSNSKEDSKFTTSMLNIFNSKYYIVEAA